MKLLPIVERELRVAARRRAAYWSRVGACLMALALMTWLAWLAPETFFNPQKSGRALFTVVSGLAFTLCLGVGGGLTADCLSAEKREGTLGLLFLTDLRGFDVVLGKLVATSLAAAYTLLAVLPVLSLALLLGGLTQMALIGTAVYLVNTMFFSLTAGMLVSALVRDERRAFTGTVSLILGVSLGLPILGALLEDFTGLPGRRGLGDLLALPSPVYGFALAMDRLVSVPGTAPATLGRFWACQFWVLVQAVLFLGLACVILPRTWRTTSRTSEGGGETPAAQAWWFGNPGPRAATRRRLLALNPVTWLTNRYRARVAAPWILLAVAVLLWFWGAGWLRVDWYRPLVVGGFAAGLQVLFKYQVAAEAGRRFAEDRRSGALEMLLATPLTAAELVRGQWLALVRIFTLPLGVVLLMHVLLVAVAGFRGGDGIAVLAWTLGVSACVMVLDCLALAWFGMWQGLRARTYTTGLVHTLGWIHLLPWLVWIVGTVTVFALNYGANFLNSQDTIFVGLLSSWALVCATVSIAAGLWGRTCLARHFKAAVVEAPARKKPPAPALPAPGSHARKFPAR